MKMQYVIRHYQPSDKELIVPLYRLVVKEQAYSAFRRVMRRPDYICVTLSVCVMGYILGGSSSACALLAGGAWAGLVYYCCRDVYRGYIRKNLSSGLADVPSFLRERPDAGFWLAEAELAGGLQIVGMVAVAGKSDGGGGGGGGGADGRDGGGATERRAELHYLIVAPWCRRTGLGSRLVQTVLHFCRERRFARVVLETTSAHTAAIALYRGMGFVHTLTHSSTASSRWVTGLSGVTALQLEHEL
ncbi:probable N-acetyltransferase CML5 [Anguilla anguilla]|uniref:probable N-acetyltransferase CML5 n=1 Tax=Anguilla anguilla TaxID=7936 RepID=UPI0015B19442|nr:probable N-acetyltransferase CML5 [Anguilla anguilla]XP_035243310.1 probable N-acetyltransferase CML5 [Anguilla anguilla]